MMINRWGIIIVFAGLVAGRSHAQNAEVAQYAALPKPAENLGTVSTFSSGQLSVSLDFRDIDIRDALQFLAKKANLNIVPTNQVAGRVTLMIEAAPLEDVFEIMIRSNGLAYEKIGSIYNIMTEKEYAARYGRAFGDLRQVRVFHLKYVVPEQAHAIIDSLKSSVGKVLLDSEAGVIMVLDTPDRLAELEQTLNALEKKTSMQIFSLRYANAEDVAKQMRQQLDMKKLGFVRADARTNQVIVQTLPDRMADVERVIAGLDQKTREVLIEARIIQIKLNDSLSIGVEWEGLFNISKKYGMTYLGSYPLSAVQKSNADWQSRKDTVNSVGYVGAYPFSGTTSNYAGGARSIGTEQMHLGVVGKNDYDVMINYLKSLGDVKILSNPKLAVTNNQEARIHVGERQAYITTTTTAGQTTTTVAEAVTFIDVGLQLFITPTINDEGFVTLKIKPEISSVIGALETGQNNRIPILDTSTAETTVMLKSGATVAVGGLRREEQGTISRHVPFLGKIPVLGVLFKQETKTKIRSELLVMVTAQIIEGDELVTGEPRRFADQPESEYKDYKPLTYESDLAEYEKTRQIREKGYQLYPELRAAPSDEPEIKPMKD
ncbi:MAG: hypothetical protein NC924_05995 [Candidatus Omnitrophica bacterium]|nr:hypothetical protein [Candidatus Omnitrophota bacterium]